MAMAWHDVMMPATRMTVPAVDEALYRSGVGWRLTSSLPSLQCDLGIEYRLKCKRSSGHAFWRTNNESILMELMSSLEVLFVDAYAESSGIHIVVHT